MLPTAVGGRALCQRPPHLSSAGQNPCQTVRTDGFLSREKPTQGDRCPLILMSRSYKSSHLYRPLPPNTL